MGNQRRYKELVFTDHALDRLRERKVEPGEAWAAWRRPDKRYYAATKQAWVFQRNWRHRQIEVVAKEQTRGGGSWGSKEWVVLSVWSNYIKGSRGFERFEKFGRFGRLVKWIRRMIGRS